MWPGLHTRGTRGGAEYSRRRSPGSLVASARRKRVGKWRSRTAQGGCTPPGCTPGLDIMMVAREARHASILPPVGCSCHRTHGERAPAWWPLRLSSLSSSGVNLRKSAAHLVPMAPCRLYSPCRTRENIVVRLMYHSHRWPVTHMRGAGPSRRREGVAVGFVRHPTWIAGVHPRKSGCQAAFQESCRFQYLYGISLHSFL